MSCSARAQFRAHAGNDTKWQTHFYNSFYEVPDRRKYDSSKAKSFKNIQRWKSRREENVKDSRSYWEFAVVSLYNWKGWKIRSGWIASSFALRSFYLTMNDILESVSGELSIIRRRVALIKENLTRLLRRLASPEAPVIRYILCQCVTLGL